MAGNKHTSKLLNNTLFDNLNETMCKYSNV